MRRLIFLGAVLVLTSAAGCAYQSPTTAPSPAPSVQAPPASIALSAVNGIGSSAGKVFLSARVYDAAGRPMGDVPLTFATTAGTVSPPVVMSDGLGLAQATVSSSAPADVSVRTGGVSAALTVTPVAILDPIAPPAPNPGPQPIPTPIPPPSQPPPPEALRVDLTFSPTFPTAGVPLNFSAFASAEIVSSSWEFGDNETAQAVGGRVTHTYQSPGTRTATVIVTDGRNRTAVGHIIVAVRPAVSATLGCTVGATVAAAFPVSCNLTMYRSGEVANGSLSNVVWNWGDGPSVNGTAAQSHPYTAAGTYTVTAAGTLTDGQSATGQTTVTVPKAP